MRTIDIREPCVMDLARQAIREAPIVVQLPAVFVLLAAPTTRGAAQLDSTKMRLAGKNYGTAIGSLELFLGQAVKEALPSEFAEPDAYEAMTGAFIRLRFRDPDVNSSVIRAGTHQGVLLDGPHRQLFRSIEASFAEEASDTLWKGGPNYTAPLCTSCNESGHPDGSIVSETKALAFARSRGIALVVTGPMTRGELGSYPILGFERDRVSVHREGPRLNEFKARIPERLRAGGACELTWS